MIARSLTKSAFALRPLSRKFTYPAPRMIVAHNRHASNSPQSPPALEDTPPTNFENLNMSSQAPSTAIDSCSPRGFTLNSGLKITDGSGLLLMGGEAFRWKPWATQTASPPDDPHAVWDAPEEAFGVLSLVWPRPDILVLGVGPYMRPISKRVREHLSSLGIRLELAATPEAAAAYNLLATERGISQIAAALLPIAKQK